MASVLKTDIRETVSRVRIPPLPKIKTSQKRGFWFLEGGAIPTAWYRVGIRKPEPYASLSASRTGEARKASMARRGRERRTSVRRLVTESLPFRILVLNFHHISPLGWTPDGDFLWTTFSMRFLARFLGNCGKSSLFMLTGLDTKSHARARTK